jgi:lipoprotein signal peptidase
VLLSVILVLVGIAALIMLKPRYDKNNSKDTAATIVTVVCMVFLLALDRITKIEMPVFLEDKGKVDIIPGIISLRLLEGGNTGAAWGIFSDSTWLLVIFSMVIVFVALYLMFFKRFYSFWMHLSVMLIIAGGMGNLYDRAVYGAVTDFFEFQFVSFPIFNVADCYVSVGAVLLLVAMLFMKKDDPIFTKPTAARLPQDKTENEAEDAE